MRPTPSSRSPALAARFLPPLAVVAALLGHATQQVDAQAAAETAYLAILAAVLLSAVAALEGLTLGAPSPQRFSAGPTAAVLVVLAAWVLPAGPLRGGAVIALGVAAVAVTAGRRLVGGSPPGPTAAPPSTASLFALTLPLAVVVQFMVRADRLLDAAPDWRLLAGLLGLPLVAAGAAALLTARGGRAPALTATATAALLGPGFTTLTTGGLVLLAAAVVAWRPEGAGSVRERRVALAVVAVAAVALAAIEPAAGLLGAGVALAMAGTPLPTLVVAAAAALAGTLLPATAGWQGDLALAATTVAPLALVVAAAAATHGARRWAAAAVAVALAAVVAARAGVGLPLLALPGAALPLLCGRMLAARSPAGRHLLFVPQVVWSAALLVAALLAASYPWLRAEPLASALALFGLAAPGGWSAATVGAAAAVAVALEVAGRRPLAPLAAARRVPSPPRAAGLVAGFLVVAAWVASPSAERRVVLPSAVALEVAQPRVELDLEGRGTAGKPLVVTVETSLSHAVAVADSTPVATFRLVGAGTGVAGDAVLRAGSDTAEWAIRRPDVAASAAHPAPRPWLARVTGEGFFGLVFRSRIELPAAAAGARLVVERHPSLPDEAVVHLHRVEVGR